MASWYETFENDELIECSVCMVQVSRKKMHSHLANCATRFSDKLESMGLIRCPLHELHIMPVEYLNHHLEGSCDVAMNRLRPFFQDPTRVPARGPPVDFLSDVPDNVLNVHNKTLLYYLKVDFKGNDLSDNKELYPEE